MKAVCTTLLVSLAWLASSPGLEAQTPAEARPSPAEGPAQSAQSPQDDEAWPLSVGRVRRLLERREAIERARNPDDLRIDYYIEVYGKAGRIDVLKDFDFTSQAVPYGGMTHREFLDLTTPQEFRSPAMSLSSIAYAAAQWAYERAEKKRREAEERRAREQARRIYEEKPERRP